MKRPLKILTFLALLFCLFLPSVPAETGANGGSAATPETEKLGMIASVTGKLLAHNHYRKKSFDAALSPMIFDEYLKLLDAQKYYFTQEDLAAFEERKSRIAPDLILGKADIAFDLYDLYKRRFSEYHAFAVELFKQQQDFTADEFLVPDRRMEPRAKNAAELRELWKLKLKGDLLYYRLLSRTMRDASKRAGSPGDDGEDAAIRKLWEAQTPEEKVLKRLRDIQNSIDQQDKMDILGMYLTAAALVFGPHSSYYPPKLDEDFEISMSLSLTGIGATLSSDDGFIKVVDLVPGGPADRSGRIHVEDRIIAVAQENAAPVDVVDMSVSNAVKLIRGPENTRVTLTVLPGAKGRNAIPENVTLTRAKVILKDSEAKGEVREIARSEGTLKIGVIELPSFYMDFEALRRGEENYKSCTRDVEAILKDFAEKQVDGVILDLRGNGGGSLPEAISLTGLFIPTGPVVQIRNSSRRIYGQYDEDPAICYHGPLVVMTNKLSASASEIVAGALRDSSRALVVGDSRTFGKGTVLDVIPLERVLRYITKPFPAGSVKYETAMFYRINGASVQQLGISPDIQLPSLTEVMEIGEKYGDFSLPWDTIPAMRFSPYTPELNAVAPELRKKSEKRVSASEKFGKLKREMAYLREQKEKNRISLHEEKRYQEYLAAQKLSGAESAGDAEADEIALRRNSGRGKRGGKVTDDIHLEETLLISADYIDALARVRSEQSAVPAAARNR